MVLLVFLVDEMEGCRVVVVVFTCDKSIDLSYGTAAAAFLFWRVFLISGPLSF